MRTRAARASHWAGLPLAAVFLLAALVLPASRGAGDAAPPGHGFLLVANLRDSTVMLVDIAGERVRRT